MIRKDQSPARKIPLDRRLRKLATMPMGLGMSTTFWLLSKVGSTGHALAFLGKLMQSPKIKADGFKGYQPTRHDVFVCTYAKSGTNWAMQIAYQIATHGHGEYDHIHDVVAWPEAPLPDVIQLPDKATYQEPTGMRVIKTHLESDYVPYSPEAKYIVVVRDPKEVFVSSYFFGAGMFTQEEMVPVESWLKRFLHGPFMHGSWAEHLASYWPWRTRQNVLILTFKEMKEDLEGTVRRVADLMGVELGAQELALVVEKSKFSFMKQIDHKFRSKQMFPFNRESRRPPMIRKGERGGAGELIDRKQQVKIDMAMKADLLRLRCDFPYDEIIGTVS